jgi:hypothetical protein
MRGRGELFQGLIADKALVYATQGLGLQHAPSFSGNGFRHFQQPARLVYSGPRLPIAVNAVLGGPFPSLVTIASALKRSLAQVTQGLQAAHSALARIVRS